MNKRIEESRQRQVELLWPFIQMMCKIGAINTVTGNKMLDAFATRLLERHAEEIEEAWQTDGPRLSEEALETAKDLDLGEETLAGKFTFVSPTSFCDADGKKIRREFSLITKHKLQNGSMYHQIGDGCALVFDTEEEADEALKIIRGL